MNHAPQQSPKAPRGLARARAPWRAVGRRRRGDPAPSGRDPGRRTADQLRTHERPGRRSIRRSPISKSGAFDWLTVTSATTVDVLFAHRATIPASTKVAAVGETTAAALQAVGYRVDLVPERDNSAAGMAEQMIALEPEARDILTLRSEIAKPVLTRLLVEAGHRVRSVVAYRTVGVPVTDRIAEDVRNGRINAILVTSGSVAEQVQLQFPEIPTSTVIAAIGPRTAKDARRAGLPVDVVAATQTVDALIEAVARFTLPHAADEFAP